VRQRADDRTHAHTHRGFHAKAGTAHAEVKAIQNALDNGATDADLKGN
jgi:pyrimidine deaminase RibD-like protein